MIRHSFVLENASAEVIHGDLWHRQDVRNAPVVLIMHGFKAFKDWGFFPDICARLTESGYVAINFNFSRNGIGSDPRHFTEMDKFAENTVSHEISDAVTVLEAIKSGKIGKKIIDPEAIGFVGHDRGGAIALITAAEHQNDCQCVVTWATVANLFRFTDDQIQQWDTQGYIEIENSHTRQNIRINKTYWQDLNANQARFNLLEVMESFDLPVLFIHGSEDPWVPADESQQLFDHCRSSSKRLEIIEGANHTFGIQNPMEQSTSAYEIVADLTENWLDSYLRV